MMVFIINGVLYISMYALHKRWFGNLQPSAYGLNLMMWDFIDFARPYLTTYGEMVNLFRHKGEASYPIPPITIWNRAFKYNSRCRSTFFIQRKYSQLIEQSNVPIDNKKKLPELDLQIVIFYKTIDY